MKKLVASLCILLFSSTGRLAMAQCTVAINSFPYAEDFESGNGNWSSGGTASSWRWGIINKPVITAAASGQNGWTTGGLTGAAYNDGEDSWLRSPCFDFSGLTNPMISFKIFWETERQYDGASIEYSTNGGTTWSLLGSQNSNTNCDGENWFNYSPVRYLGNEPGWSGNIQPSSGSCVGGGGSGAWLTAKHKLSFLAGRNNVRFRFRFGAGTSCNQYDGFAIDDFRIDETPTSPTEYTSQCSGFAISFFTVNRVCQTGISWNFGDPASGTANTSNSFTPQHIFSGPGSYTVTMTVTFSGAPTATTTIPVKIIEPTIAITSPVLCNGDANASATVTVNPPGSYSYFWSSDPSQNTPSVTNLSSGSYQVTVTGADVCQAAASINITEPSTINIALTPINANCSSGTGSISSSVSGGVLPYTYTWSDGSTGTSINNKLPGGYTLTLRDANGCMATSTATIAAPVNNIQVTPTITNSSCGNNNGSISISASGGTAPYTYLWSSGQTTSNINNLASGNYSVTIQDAAGCSFTSTPFPVTNVNATISITPSVVAAQCGSSTGSIAISTSGGTAPYSYAWNTGATSPSINNLNPGSYNLTVTDVNGCTATSGNVVVGNNNPTIAINLAVNPAVCTSNNGSISISPSGGTAPYSFLWNTGATSPSITNLSPGNYSVTVTDSNGCSESSGNISVSNANSTITITPQIMPAKCIGDNGAITLTLSGGTAPYSFLWSNGEVTQNLNSLATGSYSVDVTDANGCTASIPNIVVNRSNNSLNINLGADRNYCPGMSVNLSPGNGFSSYLWQSGETSPSINVTEAGTYSVIVTDASGCRGTDSVFIYSNCNNLYFPSAFTPNGDGLNETFGALGDFTGLRDYHLVVYGRWGQEVFRTTDPSQKWDGTYKGKIQGMHSYTWVASYTIGNRLTEVVKGSVILIR